MGTFVVRRKGIAALAALLVCIACNKPAQRAKVIARGEPQIRATVITMQTALQPANKTYTHQIVIADGRARSMNEVDGWRLFDFKHNNVMFVDEIAKTYRTESIVSLVQKRRAADRGELPDHTPRAQIVATGAHRVLQGINTSQSLIRAGAYQRELWIGEHPSIPSNLFAVMQVSDGSASSFAPMMKAIDDAFIDMKGFPLVDRAELPYGKTKMMVDRTVVSVQEKDVPQSWLNVGVDYREIKAPAAGRPPASSRPPSQRTPAAGSQSSSTVQKTP